MLTTYVVFTEKTQALSFMKKHFYFTCYSVPNYIVLSVGWPVRYGCLGVRLMPLPLRARSTLHGTLNRGATAAHFCTAFWISWRLRQTRRQCCNSAGMTTQRITCYITFRNFNIFQNCVNGLNDSNYDDCISLAILSNLGVGSFNDRLRVQGALKALQWICSGSGTSRKESVSS